MRIIFIFAFVLLSHTTLAKPHFAHSSLVLISGPEDFCDDGPMKLVDAKTLLVGPALSFSIEAQDKVAPSADGKCLVRVNNKIEKDKLFKTTTISKCSPDLKSLESIVMEELHISSDQVIYKHTMGKTLTTCLFKRSLK